MNDQLNGITVDGKSVHEYIVKKELDEKTKEAADDFRQNESKNGFYNSPRTKIVGKNTSKSSTTTLLPRSQINREYWRKNMKSQNGTIVVIALLLKGDRLMAKQMTAILEKERPSIAKKVNAPALLNALYKSELGALMIKKNISATSRPIYQWSLTPNAYDLTVKELYGLYDSRNIACTLRLLGAEHEWIPTHLKAIKWKGPVKKAKVKVAEKPERVKKYVRLKGPKIKKTLPTPDVEKELLTDKGKKTITGVIEKAISSALGVNVKIDMDVNVRFGLLK